MISRADAAAISSYDDLDPYGGSSGYAVIESYEEDNFHGRETMTCSDEDGEIAFREECARVRRLRNKDKSLSPIVVRLMDGGGYETLREVI